MSLNSGSQFGSSPASAYDQRKAGTTIFGIKSGRDQESSKQTICAGQKGSCGQRPDEYAAFSRVPSTDPELRNGVPPSKFP
jgi:hypothetical protein